MDMNEKTVIQQFEENRKNTASFIIDSRMTKVMKNEIGNRLQALVASAYAAGFAHGSQEREMTTEKWVAIIHEPYAGNDFIREMLNSIIFDFHALGGVK